MATRRKTLHPVLWFGARFVRRGWVVTILCLLALVWLPAFPLTAAGSGLLAGVEPGNNANDPAVLRVYDATGNAVRSVTLPIPLEQLAEEAIAPDGRHLVYYTGAVSTPSAAKSDDLTLHIVRLDAPGGPEEAATVALLPPNFPANLALNAQLLLQRDPTLDEFGDLEAAVWWGFAYALQNFAWSPDGSQLAFSAATDGPSSDLYLYDTTTGEITRLTDGIEQIDAIRWSPDGAWVWHSSISFGLCQGCDGGRYAAAADGSGVVVQPGTDVDRFLAWIDAGSYLSTDQANGPGDFALSRVDLASGRATLLWPGTHQAYVYDPVANRLGVVGTVEPRWSPDSQVYVIDLAINDYVEYATVEDAIAAESWLEPLAAPAAWVCDRPGLQVYPCNPTRFDPLSPDGTYQVTEDGAVVRAANGSMVLDPDNATAGAGVLWSPDSRSYATLHAGHVTRRDLATGTVRTLSARAARIFWLVAPATSTTPPALPTPETPPAQVPTPLPTAEIARPMRQRVLLDSVPDTARALRLDQARQLALLAGQVLSGTAPLTTPDDGLPLLLAREAVRTTYEPYYNILAGGAVVPEAGAALDAVLAGTPAWQGVFPTGGELPTAHSLALRPDGRVIAVGYGDGTVRLWEVASGTLVRTLESSDTIITYLAYSGNGSRLAAVDQSGVVQVWDTDGGWRLTRHEGRYQGNSAVAFRPGTTDLAIANGLDPVVMRPATGPAQPLTAEPAEALAFSPDGSRLAVALLPAYLPTQSTPYTEPYIPPQRGIEVRAVDSGDLIYTVMDDAATLFLAFSPDGDTLVSITSTRLRAYDAANGTLRVEAPLDEVINGAAFMPDGNGLALLTHRAGVTLWNLETGAVVSTLPTDANILAWLAVHPTRPDFISVDVSGRPVYIDGATGAIAYGFDHPTAAFAATHPTLPWVVTAGGNRVAVRNITAQRIEHELVGAENPITELAISPDGAWVAVVESTGHVTLWDIYTPAPIWRTQVTQVGLAAVALAPDGRVVVGGKQGYLAVLDPADGHAIIQAGLTGDVVSLAVGGSNDLAVIVRGPKLFRYDLDALGEGPRQVVIEQGPEATALAYSPDGTQLAVARRHGPTWPSQVEVWSTPDNRLLRTLEIEAGYTTQALAYNHDGTRLATGATGSRAITLWDTATGEVVQELAAPGVMSFSDRLAFAAGDALILAGQPFGVTHIYSLTPTHTLRTLPGHAGSVWDVAIHPTGREALSAGDDATVRRWDWQTGAQIGQFVPQPERVYSVAYHPTGESVLVAGEDGEVRIYSSQGDSLRLTVAAHRGAVQSAVFRPDGREIATAGQDGSVRVWSSSTGAPQWSVEGLPEGLDALAYAPYGDLLAAGAGAGPRTTIYLWDAYTGEEVMQLTGHRSYIAALTFSPNGELLASASWDHTVKLWEVASGDLLATLEGHTELLTDLAFSPDGSLLASIAEDYTLRLWNPATGAALETVTLPRALPWALAFDPAGHALITAHADGKLRTWLVNPADNSLDTALLVAAARIPRATAAFTLGERRIYGIDTHVGAYALSASGNINRSEPPRVTSLIVLPGSPQGIMGLTDEGFLIESADRGEAWHLRARLPLTLTAASLGIPARADDPLLFATAQGLYRRETDGGYTQINSLPMHAVSYSHTNPDELWGVTRDSVLKSEDGGATWGEADANLFPNRLVGPMLMAAPNNNPQFLMGYPANVPALIHWRGTGNGFWEQLPGLPPLPLYLRDGFGMAWDNQNQTLYLSGAAGELYASDNAAAPSAAAASAVQIAQFGLGVRAIPLAVGPGPTLYVTLLTPYGAELVRGEWDGRRWEWVWLNLPVMAMG